MADWATEPHQICVIDRDRQALEEKQIEHSGSGVSQLIELLLKRSGDRPISWFQQRGRCGPNR